MSKKLLMIAALDVFALSAASCTTTNETANAKPECKMARKRRLMHQTILSSRLRPMLRV